jgi:3-oxoadipate enol-lactonase
MAYADLADVRLHYTLDGDVSKPVLVMSNSLGTSGQMWAPQVAALSRHFHLLRYDTRGHGESTVTPGPYSIPQLAGDVLGLLDTLGLKRVHFCGLSMGGITGMWLGVNAPDRIDHLILSNTAAFIGPSDAWTTRAARVATEGIGSIADAVVSRWLTPDHAAAHPQQVADLRALLCTTPDAGYAANCIAVRDADLREDVARITAPTLVISGAGDVPTPPADGQYLASHIKGARYVELAGAHLSNQEEPARFSRTVLEFLGVNDTL